MVNKANINNWWNVRVTFGSIDGKQMAIRHFRVGGSVLHNYKDFNPLTMVDAE